MSELVRLRPYRDPWTAALHRGERAGPPYGGGVVIGQRQVLTCAHLVPEAPAELWVAFPKAGVAASERRLVGAVRRAADRTADVAVLELAEPVPPEVRPAPLRCPEPADLAGEQWWAFGFPEDEPFGSDAHGVVGSPLSYGWVRLELGSRYPVRPGFSGGGVWSPRYEAVVGLIGQVQPGGPNLGDALALTLHQVDRELPDEKIAVRAGWSVAAAGESALAAWGWTLADDPEAGRHWRPRARGVAVDSEGGFRFRGRRAALAKLIGWLDRSEPDGRVLVVTGSPGVGKSSVLGRVVTTADREVRAALPPDDDALTATVGSVACAVHVKGKTALDVATELARAAAVRLPGEVAELVPALADRLAGGPRRFNVVLDALDEAASPQQARLIIGEIVRPLARSGGWAQVIVGTRRGDDGGDLLGWFGTDPEIVDLDRPEYFDRADLAAYAEATLGLLGAERPGNPYADPAVAGPVAARIAELAEPSFLVAGLVARRHGLHDSTAVDPRELVFSKDVDEALVRYVRRLPAVAERPPPLSKAGWAGPGLPPPPPPGGVPATLLLTALAYAQSPGLTADLWEVVLSGLGVRVDADDLEAFAGSAAGNFLVESSSEAIGDGQDPRYRLFHQAFNDALLRERDRQGLRADDERAVARALIDHGRAAGWEEADRYLLRSLPYHADRAGLLDELLADDEYLLFADLARLMPLADRATSEAGRARARLLRLTPQATAAGPAERAAHFDLTTVMERLGDQFAPGHPAPYRARWAAVASRREWTTLDGHTGRVTGLCEVPVDGRTLLASASADGTVRLWDLARSRLRRTLRHDGPVRSVCAEPGGRWLAAGCADGAIGVWDPLTGALTRVLAGEPGPVLALCPVVVAGGTLLASAGSDSTVRLWDPDSGRLRWKLVADPGEQVRVLAAMVTDRPVLASAGSGGRVRLWDPATGGILQALELDTGSVLAICAVSVEGTSWLAITGINGVAWLWNPGTGQRLVAGAGAGPIEMLCPVEVSGRQLLARASAGVLELWDPVARGSLVELAREQGFAALCAVRVEGEIRLATASHDFQLQLWEPAPGQAAAPARVPTGVPALRVLAAAGRAVVACAAGARSAILDAATGEPLRQAPELAGGVFCTVDIAGRTLLASVTASGKAWLTDPETGDRVRVLERLAHASRLCPIEVEGRPRLAAARYLGDIRLWDPAAKRTGRSGPYWFSRGREPDNPQVLALCAVTAGGGGHRLAVGCADGLVRVWDPRSGTLASELTGHRGTVLALTAVPIDGASWLASAGSDGTVRLWNLTSPLWEVIATRGQRVLEGHRRPVRGLCVIEVGGRSLLASGAEDRTVRLWDPAAGSLVLTIPVHHPVWSLAAAGDLLVAGTEAGVLAIEVS